VEQKNFFEKFWYIFIVVALILMAVVTTLWFNNQKSLKNQAETMIEPAPTSMPGDVATANLANQGDSDEVSDIENDINNTNLADLDKEMADIEVEISTPE